MFETPGSFLDEVIDRYQAQDLDAADPSRLGDDVASLSRAIDRLEAEKLRRAAERARKLDRDIDRERRRRHGPG